MSETGPTAEIARKVCDDIFGNFFWDVHPRIDSNFKCTKDHHRTSTDKPKKTHPADVVFSYDDPYLTRRIYLHTDMKSYATDSISSTGLRAALKSLCMTVECARTSAEWRQIYSVPDDEEHDVQGFLFVHNHDRGYEGKFSESMDRVSLSALPVAADTVIHFMGPTDISRLYSIANDLMRLKFGKVLPVDEHTFYYPDLVLTRRHTDTWGQPATIELLMSPFFIIKHACAEKVSAGYLIYYNRPGCSAEEFEYLFDCISRFQMLEHGQLIRIRSCHGSPDSKMLSHFEAAKKKYAKAWGFDQKRSELLEKITIEMITSVADTYNPGNVGWKVENEE